METNEFFSKMVTSKETNEDRRSSVEALSDVFHIHNLALSNKRPQNPSSGYRDEHNPGC